jgi:hypothetical protein
MRKRKVVVKMSFSIIFDVILLFLGIYIIYAGCKMKKEQQVGTLFVAQEELMRCKDVEGFVAFLFPKTLVFGGISLLFGVQGLCNDMIYAMPQWVNVLMIVLFLAAWVWFSAMLRKGKGKFLN